MNKSFYSFLGKSVIFLTWALLIFSIFVDYRSETYWRVLIWIGMLVVSFVFYFKLRNLGLLHHVMISLMILTAIFGELYLGLYYTYAYYDKITHLVNTVLIFLITYAFLKSYIKDDKKRMKYTILILAGLAVLWELIEITLDYFFDSTLLGVIIEPGAVGDAEERLEVLSPVADTILDLILDGIGIICGYLLIKKSHSKKL